jgi:hypothetical protein
VFLAENRERRWEDLSTEVRGVMNRYGDPTLLSSGSDTETRE